MLTPWCLGLDSFTEVQLELCEGERPDMKTNLAIFLEESRTEPSRCRALRRGAVRATHDHHSKVLSNGTPWRILDQIQQFIDQGFAQLGVS